MKRAHVITIFLLVLGLSGTTMAKNRFRPRSIMVLGTSQANSETAFTQVYTQRAGELALATADELFINLVPNWAKLAREFLKNPEPVVAYINVAWADQIIRITCTLERNLREFARRRFKIVMTASEGTVADVPIGTVVGVSEGRWFQEGGMTVMPVHVEWSPGVLPDVLPTAMTITSQVVPGFWKTGGPGRVLAQCRFTSVQPRDGSPPLVYTVSEGIPVE